MYWGAAGTGDVTRVWLICDSSSALEGPHRVWGGTRCRHVSSPGLAPVML